MIAKQLAYTVLTSYGGITHRGTDCHEAQRAYREAVGKVQHEGQGSVTLMEGSRVVERFQPQPSKARRSLLQWLGLKNADSGGAA